ncbi:MAG: hypothetical protein JSU06_04460 [Actinobacteria bacterium]|nr:hypothetical protein [Actinomycetota bacterium]
MKSDRRAQAAAAVTVVGLAALGAAALGSNHGLTAPVATVAGVQAGGQAPGRAPIVTSASGATIATTVGPNGVIHHSPIVTRTSSGGGQDD